MDNIITDEKSVSLSDVWDFRAQFRDHRELLRSTGHKFRNGRWEDNPDSFHVYRERIRPGLGSVRTFTGGPGLRQSNSYPDYPLDPPEIIYNWRPGIVRGFEAHDLFGDYSQPLGPPSTAAYGDFVLDLNGQGTAFIRSNRPGNPAANFGQFILELRDLPRIPQLYKYRAKFFTELGSEYLNVEFGWLPFISDLRALFRTQQNLRKLLDRLILSNGRGLRRRSKHRSTTDHIVSYKSHVAEPFPSLGNTFPDDPEVLAPSWVDGLHVSAIYPPGYTGDPWTGSCVIDVDQFIDTVVWECGTFHYYIPDVGSDRWTGQAVTTLFGLNPSPHTIYAVYPWTWLLDWFTNVGDIVSNLSANSVENEVITNAFAMREVTDRREVIVRTNWDNYENGSLHFGYHLFVPAGTDELHYSEFRRNKLRRQASPFGFGLRQNEFTTRQGAILAALSYDKDGGVRFMGNLAKSHAAR